EDIVSKGVQKVAAEISHGRNQESKEQVDKVVATVSGALTKIQEIAEKIQNNTSKMIVDSEFLTQEDVADMVMNICDEKISKLINGRVIPNDRVFYPVKPIVGTAVHGNKNHNLADKVIIITASSSAAKDIARVKRLAKSVQAAGAKQVIVLAHNQADMKEFAEFHSHSLDLLDEEALRRIFNTARTKFGQIGAVIHFTGDYDYTSPLSSMSRKQWDALIENFLYIPGLVTREA